MRHVLYMNLRECEEQGLSFQMIGGDFKPHYLVRVLEWQMSLYGIPMGSISFNVIRLMYMHVIWFTLFTEYRWWVIIALQEE